MVEVQACREMVAKAGEDRGATTAQGQAPAKQASYGGAWAEKPEGK
jgi:hypothetical protein